MKTLQITTKRKADSLLLDSLFKPVNGHTLDKIKWCTGKYSRSLLGEEIEVSDHVHAVWSERRKNADGPYYTLYCYRTYNRGE